MKRRTAKLLSYVKHRFKDMKADYLCEVYNNLVFIFGVLHKENKLYNYGERCFVTCYRRRNRNGKEYLYWSSSWVLDGTEMLSMKEGFEWIIKKSKKLKEQTHEH